MSRASVLLLALLALSGVRSADRIIINDNKNSAGVLENGVLTIHLEARTGIWHPNGDSNPGATVQAFAEEGQAPLIPGPMIRVPAGTQVDLTLRNSIPGAPLVVRGLGSDSILVSPGARDHIRFKLSMPGTYYYWGTTTGRKLGMRLHEDSQLTGAIVVDDSMRAGRYIPARDRVLLIGLMGDTTGGEDLRTDRKHLLFTINGRPWPGTERLKYQMGDTIRWRIINATVDPHPMHLHGTYFTIESRGDGVRDSIYARSRRDVANTEWMPPGGTIAISWIPGNPGNWLFHCHIPEHFGPRGPLGALPMATADPHTPRDHAQESMGGLVMGVTVKPRSGAAPTTERRAPRRLRLLVRANTVAAGVAPSYGFSLHERGEEPRQGVSLAGAPIVLVRGEPVAITVANRSDVAAAVHWHGIELESYFDGVPGFSGIGTRLTPLIAAQDSFIARFTPPRAGTFMYHTHVGEGDLKVASLAGMIIVEEPGHKFDPETEIPILISSPTSAALEAKAVLINGLTDVSPVTMNPGKRYRLRLANITSRRPGIFAQVKQDSLFAVWTPVAKDGADLPAERRVPEQARHRISIGETMDFELTPVAAADMVLQIATSRGKLLASVPLHVR